MDEFETVAVAAHVAGIVAEFAAVGVALDELLAPVDEDALAAELGYWLSEPTDSKGCPPDCDC